MQRDILEMIKQDYNDMKKISNGDYSDILELEEDPLVQRYRYLMRLKESRDLREYGERCIVGKIMDKYGHGVIKESNNIWCLLFESTAKNIKEIPLTYSDEFDEEQIVIVYRDVENSTRMIAISKENQEKFESTHNVVYGNSQIHDYSDRYYNIRHSFFNDCIEEDQDVAIKRLLPKK